MPLRFVLYSSLYSKFYSSKAAAAISNLLNLSWGPQTKTPLNGFYRVNPQAEGKEKFLFIAKVEVSVSHFEAF